MKKDESRDRAISCRYNPTEVGQYVLHIQWSGDHVPGSPFTVTIVDSRCELDRLAVSNFAGPPAAQGFSGAPIILDAGSPDFDGGNTIQMSTFNGDGLFFNDDN